MSHPGATCRDDERGRTSCPPLREVGNVIPASRDATIPPVFPSSHPSFRHPTRLSVIPPVFPVIPPVFPVIPPPLPSFHHPSRHSGERRNLRPLPGVVCPRVWRKGTPYAGMCSDRREWGSATSGVARRPELIRCPSESGLRGFPLSPERRHLCKSNSSPAPKLRDDSCILEQLRVQTGSRAYRPPANCGTHVGA